MYMSVYMNMYMYMYMYMYVYVFLSKSKGGVSDAPGGGGERGGEWCFPYGGTSRPVPLSSVLLSGFALSGSTFLPHTTY